MEKLHLFLVAFLHEGGLLFVIIVVIFLIVSTGRKRPAPVSTFRPYEDRNPPKRMLSNFHIEARIVVVAFTADNLPIVQFAADHHAEMNFHQEWPCFILTGFDDFKLKKDSNYDVKDLMESLIKI